MAIENVQYLPATENNKYEVPSNQPENLIKCEVILKPDELQKVLPHE